MPSVDRLKTRLAQSLKARQIDAALGALHLLEQEEPHDPSWPLRTARLLRAKSNRRAEVAALRRALEIQVDRGLVLDAIASCKALLELAPDDEQTLETLDLLYMDSGSAALVAAPPSPRRKRERKRRARRRAAPKGFASPIDNGETISCHDAPLQGLHLSEVLPDARPLQLAHAEPGGINEIPLEDEVSLEDAPVIDLRLEVPSSEGSPAAVAPPRRGDSPDVAAAQRSCLPTPADAAGTSRTAPADRGVSLRSELANVPLFGDLDPGSLHTLIHRARVVMLEAGQILFRQGDPANTLYVVVDGAVVPIAEGDRRRKLAVLERGEFFGEIGLLAQQPRNATIEALVDSKLLAIDRRVVRELIDEQPSVAKGILRFLRTRLIDRQIRTNPFFSVFAHAEREEVARQFRFLEVKSGTPVVSQGQVPEGLFVVLSGELGVIDAETEKEEGELGLGDVFGGLSLIDGRPAVHDVVARSKCWLVVLGEARFRRILESNPQLDRVLRRLAAEGARSGEGGPGRAPL